MALTTLDIKEPGLNALPPGVERYIVEGGGLTGIQIFPDDEIELVSIFFFKFDEIVSVFFLSFSITLFVRYLSSRHY